MPHYLQYIERNQEHYRNRLANANERINMIQQITMESPNKNQALAEAERIHKMAILGQMNH